MHTHNIFKKLSLLAVVESILFSGASAQPKPDEELLTTAKRFLEVTKKTMMKGVTAIDVEKALAFYTDDVVYEHVRFKSESGRERKCP